MRCYGYVGDGEVGSKGGSKNTKVSAAAIRLRVATRSTLKSFTQALPRALYLNDVFDAMIKIEQDAIRRATMSIVDLACTDTY